MQSTNKKRKGKRLHWGNFATPANHVRVTRAQRLDEHKARMKVRRRRQLTLTSGFIPVSKVEM